MSTRRIEGLERAALIKKLGLPPEYRYSVRSHPYTTNELRHMVVQRFGAEIADRIAEYAKLADELLPS